MVAWLSSWVVGRRQVRIINKLKQKMPKKYEKNQLSKAFKKYLQEGKDSKAKAARKDMATVCAAEFMDSQSDEEQPQRPARKSLQEARKKRGRQQVDDDEDEYEPETGERLTRTNLHNMRKRKVSSKSSPRRTQRKQQN